MKMRKTGQRGKKAHLPGLGAAWSAQRTLAHPCLAQREAPARALGGQALAPAVLKELLSCPKNSVDQLPQFFSLP